MKIKNILLTLLIIAISLLTGCGGNKNPEEENIAVTYDRLRLSAPGEVNFESFEGVDSKGNKINESIFADYDLTLINCWTTWCPYCIQEMPALNELYNELPENVNLISVCFDAYEMPEDFEAILNDNPHEYTVVAGSPEFNNKVGAENVTGVPSTLFADKSGKIIGQISGVPLSDNSTKVDETIKGGYIKLINDALEILNEK